MQEHWFISIVLLFFRPGRDIIPLLLKEGMPGNFPLQHSGCGIRAAPGTGCALASCLSALSNISAGLLSISIKHGHPLGVFESLCHSLSQM